MCGSLLEPIPAETSTMAHSEGNLAVLGFTVMPLMTFKQDQYTVIAVIDGEFTASEWARAVEHIDGTFDWWHGEVIPGIDAYVIVQEDANGFTGNPDWSELPELFQSVIVAGLRGTLPA